MTNLEFKKKFLNFTLLKKLSINNKTRLIISVSSNPTNFGTTIYNYIFDQLNLNFIYVPFRLTDSQQVVSVIKTLDLVGCSVSSPLKSQVVKYMDDLDLNAQILNNINTIKNIDGKLKGYNTDYFGFKSIVDNKNVKSALIYGNGSVAKTIYQVLIDIGVNNIYITGRNIDNVVKFKKDLHNSKIYENQKVDLIVNATKAGTLKEGEIFEYINYSDKLIDLNVCKKDTYLVSSALSLGIEVIKGSEMSINQLKKQFEIYTEMVPDEELLSRGLEKFFKS